MSSTLKKNQTAKIPTKSGNEYSYQYVDIAQIHEYLENNGMRYIQKIERIDGDDYVMTKRYIDKAWEPEWLQGSKVVDAVLFGNDNPAQKQGSALTYARRYSLLMAFGLATEDDDANSLGHTKEVKLISPKQKEIILANYVDDNLAKLLEVNKIGSIDEMTTTKASDIIKALYEAKKKKGSEE